MLDYIIGIILYWRWDNRQSRVFFAEGIERSTPAFRRLHPFFIGDKMKDLMTMEKTNQEQFMLDIVNTKGKNLPANIEDVLEIFEFTDFKAKAWRIMSDKMKRLDEQTEAYNSALRSGQKWGIAALYAQKRMGELTPGIKVEYPNKNLAGHPANFAGVNKNGIPRGIYQEAEQLAKNPEVLDRVIKNSEERGEIPTKTAVLNTIRAEKYQKRQEERKIKTDDRVVKETPKVVKDYFDANREYKDALMFAVKVAERGLFSPESINLVRKRHEEIIKLMRELEELI